MFKKVVSYCQQPMDLKNFSKFEDNPLNLINAANKAVKNAVRESKALGLSITYATNGTIIREASDGTIQKLGEIDMSYRPRKVEKGQTIYVKRS